jgi:mannopine transport system substrate-binding protein
MPVNRRTLIASATALGLPFSRSAHAQGALESTLLIRTTGGAFEAALKKNFFDPFSKATGTRIIPFAATYGDMMAKTAAMQAAGRVEWDIIAPQYSELSQISQYLTDLGDCSAMPNVAKEGVAGTCGRYGVLYLTGAQCLTWNPDLYKGRAPQSWADFFDTAAFPGRRALPNTGSPWATLILAALADGVPREQLFPLELDRIFRKLDTIKPHIATWWRTGDQSQKMWDGDEIAMSLMWSGSAFAAKQRGAKLAWTYNQAIADFGAWSILKNAPHPNAARAFIDFYLANPEAHAAFSREIGYTTSSKASQALLSPQEKEELISSPERLAGIVTVDYDWLAANRAAVLNRFNAWVSG